MSENSNYDLETIRNSTAHVMEQGRQDLADPELAQVAIIEKYLPAQMDETEVKSIVDSIIVETGASSMADMGKVMGMANQKMAGKADGKVIANFVKAALAN